MADKFPLGTLVAFYWRSTDEYLTGVVVAHITFNGETLHSVRVNGPSAIDPQGCPGGRVYDVWPDMSIAPLTLPMD